MQLSGQAGLVTGAGRGAGRRIAFDLAARGMAVALVARSVDQLDEAAAEIEEAGGQALVVPGDVTDREAVNSMVARVEGELGPIELLVNNAGVAAWGEFLATDPDDWWRTVEIDLRGPALCSYYTLKRMVPRHRGRIVNVASNAGAGPRPLGSEYAVAKAALFRLTDSLAASTREHGVAVFAVSPGLVHTEMTRGRFEDEPEDRWTPVEAVGYLVAELASGCADRLTGRYLDVRDDLDELLARAEEVEREDLLQLRLRPLSSRPEGGEDAPENGDAGPETRRSGH